jgi:hypothetical protein
MPARPETFGVSRRPEEQWNVRALDRFRREAERITLDPPCPADPFGL